MSNRYEAPLPVTTSWGERRIDYALHLERRRDLVITVYPDLRVRVRAPSEKSLAHVQRRVDAKRSWIVQQLREFERLTPLPAPRFVSGETFFHLGREYRLRIVRKGSGVALQGGRLVVRVPSRAGPRSVRAAVNEWIRARARSVLHVRVAKLQREIGVLTGLNVRLRVRAMMRRWGSCTASGNITINPVLLQAPLSCVDYVLVHELVHLIEQAHSRRFYSLLARAMPDWRARRERLARAALRWE